MEGLRLIPDSRDDFYGYPSSEMSSHLSLHPKGTVFTKDP